MARLAPWLMVVAAAGCGPGAHAPPDGGPPLALTCSIPLATQIGLHYGKIDEPAGALPRRRRDARRRSAGATVHFSIFDDPAGSTLARDQVKTDANGIATVTLTAGQAEASFFVDATAVNAPKAEFDISVSKFDFVEVDAQLAWSSAVDPARAALRRQDVRGAARRRRRCRRRRARCPRRTRPRRRCSS